MIGSLKIIGIDKNTLTGAVKAIELGKVIVFPTDTVYGLLCHAKNEKAVRRLFKMKGRSEGKPLPIFTKDIKMAKRLAYIDRRQKIFLRKHWPGRVTIVLRAKKALPKALLGENKTVGLRIPNHHIVMALLNRVKQPLTGTSANVSGQSPCWSTKAVVRQFKGRKYKPELIIDAGRLSRRKPSRVVDLTVWPPKILRK